MSQAAAGSRPVLLSRLPILVVFALYSGLEIALFVAHITWRDEGQSWLWALELSTPVEFFVVPGEGHPPLWYWLLRAFAFALSFDQARLFTLVLCLANAALLLRLLRDDLLVAVLFLFSSFLLHSWGYNFRPYTVILTLTLFSLLLDRAGRSRAATWLMALACGFHFFAGFLFAFWLHAMWRRGLRFAALLPASLLALAFGALAILSGQGNAEAAIDTSGFALDTLRIFGAPFSATLYSALIAAPLAAVLLAITFRHDLISLAAYLAVAALYSLFAALVYGHYDWHLAFLVVLLLMAYVTARPLPTCWPLILLLAPGLVFGLFKAAHDIGDTEKAERAAYLAITADAGDRLDSARNLVSWPDFLILGIATQFDFHYLSGNNGALAGPVRMAERRDFDIDAVFLAGMPTPYWLYCFRCGTVLDAIGQTGRTATELYAPDPRLSEPIGAYRID